MCIFLDQVAIYPRQFIETIQCVVGTEIKIFMSVKMVFNFFQISLLRHIVTQT